MILNKISLNICFILSVYHKCLASKDIDKIFRNNIETSIDNNVDPCEDFYAYACGDYSEQHRSNYYQEITGLMDFKFNTYILKLMETLYQHDHQVIDQCQSFVEKTRVYLKSCLREKERDIKRYFEVLKPGPQLNWPIWEPSIKRNFWPEKEFNMWSLLGKIQSYGLNNVLINQEVTVDNEGKFNIKMEPAYCTTNSTLPELNIVKFFLMTLGTKNPKEDLKSVMKTNKNLVKNYEIYDELIEEQQILLGDLETKYTNINLSLFIQELVSQKLPPDTLITIRNTNYFQFLNDNLEQQIKPIDMCNYLMLKFLYYLAKDSTTDFKSLDCIIDLRNKMDLAVNFLYYHHEYAFRAKDYNSDIEMIMKNLKNTFKYLFLKNNLNLTSYQQEFILDKLYHMRLNIGNLPENVTFNKVEEFYENVPALDKNNYYKNHLLLLKHRFAKTLLYGQNQSHYIVPDNHLGSSSGAFYVSQQNMIILPFGSLSEPLYNAHAHDLYKYSLLGFILAHEFTHAFETSGLYYDAGGNTLPKQESDILENENFQESLECLQSQLPTESIDERIADIVAIDLVYNFYISKSNNLQPESLSANWNKYFYLNLAQFFCGKNNVKFIDHDTDAERLNQIVMNSQGFANAFKCSRNSTMNPNKKCRLY